MAIYQELFSHTQPKKVMTTADAEMQSRRAVADGLSIEEMRREYEETGIPENYSGYRSILLVSAISLTVILTLAAMLNDVSALEWVVVPVTLLYANLAEYALHRWIMHQPFPGMKKLYVRHALTHHRLYRANSMSISKHRELQAILLPWYIILVYMGMFIAPGALIVGVFFSWNAAYLFAIAAIAYYWHYEFLHMMYHAPKDSAVLRKLPFMKFVARHHTIHHEMHHMTNKNFNHTYPLFDLLFGTHERGD